jgi:hypothetical protein
MPFGLDLKSLVVGILAGWFLIPLIMGLFNRGANRNVVA